MTCYPSWSTESLVCQLGVFEAPLVKGQRFWSPGFGSQVPSHGEIKVTVWPLSLFPRFQVDLRVPAEAGFLQVCVTQSL